MPSVVHVAIGKAGAKNAAVLAVQILALSDKSLAGKLARQFRTSGKFSRHFLDSRACLYF
jgi:phosphoribosylcarboxyaminoimidazole (NCAIR) mutase